MSEYSNEDIKKRRAERRQAVNEAALKRLEEEVEEHAAKAGEREALDEALAKHISDQESINAARVHGCCGDHPFEFIKPLITFAEYQFGAKKTAIYNQDARVLYPALGLAGEVGELIEKVLAMAAHAGKCANQVKKIIRDDDCECDTPRKEEIGKEIGGVLWYCAAVCSDLGLDLGAIAQQNLGVLADRKKRGTLKGDGDNR